MTDKPVIMGSDGRKRYGEVVRLAHKRMLAIEETDLTYIRIDHQVRLQFGEAGVLVCMPGTSGEMAEWTRP